MVFSDPENPKRNEGEGQSTVHATGTKPKSFTEKSVKLIKKIVSPTSKFKTFHCDQCQKSYKTAEALSSHKKKTGFSCISSICKYKHVHNFTSETFSSQDEAEKFLIFLRGPTPWQLKTKKDTLPQQARCAGMRGQKTSCPAHYTMSSFLFEDKSSGFYVKACTTHDQGCSLSPKTQALEDGRASLTKFATMEEAIKHFETAELDAIFKINMLSNRDAHYLHYTSRRRGLYTPRHPEGETKKNNCRAYVSIKQEADGVAMWHYGEHTHPEASMAVVSSKKRHPCEEALKLGVPKQTIMKKIIKDPEQRADSPSKKINMDYLRQLERKHAPKDIDLNKSESDNVYQMLQSDSWRSFSTEKYYGKPPGNLEGKAINLPNGGVTFVFMSEEQRKVFRNNPQAIYIDSTHKTNRSGLLLMAVLVIDERGAGFPILFSIIESESQENIMPALQVLHDLLTGSRLQIM